MATEGQIISLISFITAILIMFIVYLIIWWNEVKELFIDFFGIKDKYKVEIHSYDLNSKTTIEKRKIIFNGSEYELKRKILETADKKDNIIITKLIIDGTIYGI